MDAFFKEVRRQSTQVLPCDFKICAWHAGCNPVPVGAERRDRGHGLHYITGGAPSLLQTFLRVSHISCRARRDQINAGISVIACLPALERPVQVFTPQVLSNALRYEMQ